MAGDHKCPVCQATFTRPQHVARHMRSHTGDRPYKCQHCGDQFARSDLLSRHVNKCHPNEKPLVSSAPSRRKGSASASRATTSKQACDQCVQSSLPCDGANPCSKCLHRKTRCTYVKFHRQTAPLGPGHPARLPNESPGASLPSLGGLPSGGSNPYRLSDPFFLPTGSTSLNPAAIAQSGAATNSLYANHQFSFPPPVPVSGPAYDNNAFEYAARYRAQADLLSRQGVIPPERGSSLPMIYQDAQPPPDQGSARYGQSYPVRNDPSDYSLPPPQGDVDYGYNVDGKPESYANPTSGYSANAYNQPFAFTVDTQSHNRRPSSASDTGSTTSLSHSQPSSATSSSVHLPLPADYPPHSYSRPATADGVLQDREGFSSAFGLMSLDDPDVIAGLSDGAPFFDGALINGGGSAPTASWGDGPTPRGNPGAGGEKDGQHSHQGSQNHPPAPTPSGLKELKDMWKQYMRTPLSGQPLAHEHHAGGSPKRERGLTRVASLPSVKTPSAASAAWGDPMRGAPQPQPQYAGVGPSYARTHNHPDDLRSYEQAVLARRAPLTLHLAPRRRGNTTSTAPVPSDKGVGSGSSGSPAGSDERASPAADSDGARPNFKRLPSQTLGPEYAKRPATGGMLSAAREEDISGGGGAHERARRMSFPAGGRPAVSGLHE